MSKMTAAEHVHHEPTRHRLFDTRGICCGMVCAKCEAAVRGRFRPEIFEDPNYETTEDVEDD